MLTWLLFGAINRSIYVAEDGIDANPGSQNRPFQSLQRADAELIRRRSSGDVGPIDVYLKGTFRLKKTLFLGPEVSNTRFQSWGRKHVVVSGGLDVKGWIPMDSDVVSASIPDNLRPRQLFADGLRLPIASLGPFRTAGLLNGAEKGPWNIGQDQVKYSATDIPTLSRPEDVEFVANHLWIQSRMGIQKIDSDQHVFRFDRPSVFRLTDGNEGAIYRLDNVREALSDGNFAFDGASHQLLLNRSTFDHLLPKQLVVPTISQLIQVDGAKNFSISQIDFRFTEWQPPAGFAGDGQAAITVPAAVQLDNCSDSTIEDCSLAHLGTYGIEISGKSKGNRIRRTLLDDLGGGGIKIGNGTEATTVEDCRIQKLGRLYASAIGIWIGNSGHNVISHNFIHDLYYTGISVGWTWGYGPSDANHNLIEFNDISDIGQGQLSDMGGIYMLGVAPGTIIRNNRIQRVESLGYGGWGIYLDEGSSGIYVENNLVDHTKTGSFHQHYGAENLIQNNVFLNARLEGQLIRTRREDHRSFRMERNIVQWEGTDALGSNWDGGFDSDQNIFWRTDGKTPTFAGNSLSDWQKLGHELHSIIADPQMKVTKNGTYFLRESPAKKLGIKPIDFTTVGPR